MADEINKKISVDIDVSSNGQQQINQYKDAFDNFRSSLNNLSSPLQSLNKALTDTSSALNKISTQNQTVASSGNSLKNNVSDLSDSFKLWYGAIQGVEKGFKAWETALSGGLAILLTYGPEILKWITSLIKGKEAISQATLSLGVMNKALQSTDYSNAVQQVTQLKTNIDLARKGFLDKKTVLEQYNKTLGKTMVQPMI
ncbi:MAG: hypothetical protein ACTHNW_18770 [Mucilaginibacter sp.]